jgi:hypothetical protein
MKAITENTVIPISLMLSLVGGIVWLTTIYNKTEAHEESLRKIESKQEAYLQNLEVIKVKLARIEMKLGIRLETTKNE